MKTKICDKCRIEKSISEFNKNKNSKDKYFSQCKTCKKEYDKEYHKNNKKEKNRQSEKYYRKHKKERKKYNKEYHKNNRKEINEDKKKYRKKQALYDTYTHQLKDYEEIRRDPANRDYIQIKCKEIGCQKWFNPTNSEIRSRIKAISEKLDGECNFYCSDKCKKNCSIYKRIKYPKGCNPSPRSGQIKWRNLIKKRDNSKCKICKSTKNIEAHHLFNYISYKYVCTIIGNGITLCKECHTKFHKIYGKENNTIYQFFKFMKKHKNRLYKHR